MEYKPFTLQSSCSWTFQQHSTLWLMVSLSPASKTTLDFKAQLSVLVIPHRQMYSQQPPPSTQVCHRTLFSALLCFCCTCFHCEGSFLLMMLFFYFYTDDIPLYILVFLNVPSVLDLLYSCIQDIQSWLSQNFLHLNDSKTECIIFSLDSSHSTSCFGPEFSRGVKNLRVAFINALKFDEEVSVDGNG